MHKQVWMSRFIDLHTVLMFKLMIKVSVQNWNFQPWLESRHTVCLR